MPYFVRGDDPCGHQIVNLIEADLLAPQFLPDRIESLDASFDKDERHLGFVHLLLDTTSDILQESLVLGTPFFKLFGELAIIFGMKMPEREILELTAQFTHSQTMRDRSEDIHRLFGDALSLFGTEV